MPRPEKILISACLLGQQVRYDGGHCNQESEVLQRWLRQGRLIPVCPECLGGLPVPRPACQINGGGGADVLDGNATVLSVDGHNMTQAFTDGADAALAAGLAANASRAVLKQGSPSCGSKRIHDGSFTGNKKNGMGVTAALLVKHGIALFDESEIESALELKLDEE